MPEYITIAEASTKYNISQRQIQILCEQGRFYGAKALSGVWMIPDTVAKPIDTETEASSDISQILLFEDTITNEETITLEEVCKLLSVSVATGRNWVRLGKLMPLPHTKKPLLFSKNQVTQLLSDIANSGTKMLKSRRNKKKINGNKLYSDYISGNNNIEAVNKLMQMLPVNIDERHIRVILANVGLQFAVQSQELGVQSKESAVQLQKPSVQAKEFSVQSQKPVERSKESAEQSQELTVKSHDSGGEDVSNLIEFFLNNEIELRLPASLIFDILGDITDVLRVMPDVTEALQIKFKYSPEDDVLGFIYMSLKNVGSKKSSGAYYTPAKTVNQLIEALRDTTELSQKSCLDPCCGSGNFLLRFADIIKNPTKIYGQDNDHLAVLLTRMNFALKYDINDADFLYKHFTVGNSLNDLPDQEYDIILGNPPWGYEFSEDEVTLLCQKYKTATPNGIESYDLFVEMAMSLLPKKGFLAFVLPEAILNVKTHETVRKILLEQGSFTFVSYIGNVFPDVQCPAVILGVKKEKSGEDILVYNNGKKYSISGKQNFTSDIINLRTSDKARECLEKITYSHGKVFLKDNAVFALGIVTGNNKQMVLNTQDDGSEIVLKGSDLRKYTWVPGGHYIRFTPKQFQQVAPEAYYRAPEKLLYRFICDTPVFAYDDRQTLSLNSCNILIPRIDGLSVKYVMAILNSRVVDFFCRQTFNSVKLLRTHIEQIPIPVPGDTLQQQLVAIVEDLLSGKSSVTQIYEDIDSIVMDLYRLTSAEKELIRSYSAERNLFLG